MWRAFASVLLFCAASAHPFFLDCGELSTRIAGGATIMGYPVQEVALAAAPIVLTPVAGSNYTIRLTSDGCGRGCELVMQATGGLTLDNFGGTTICGTDPKQPAPGHGLCQKCPVQLFTRNYDCQDMNCLFEVGNNAAAAGSILIAWGSGDAVKYASVPFPPGSVEGGVWTA